LRASIFREGVRVPNTMLTVIGPAYPGSWSFIKCLCDCGKETTVVYQNLRAGQFSCGCKRKTRFDAADHTDFTAFTAYGNGGYGRKLTILYYDADNQCWMYLCHCCAEVFQLPRGARRGVQEALYDLAGGNCPNFPGAFVRAFEANDRIGFTSGGARMPNAEMLARKLEARGLNRFVKRDYKGEIQGFYIPLDGSFPAIKVEQWEVREMVEREPELLKLGMYKPPEPKPVKQVVAEDAEGFAELDKTAED